MGLVAGTDSVSFGSFQVRRIDWPTLTLPNWHVYDGMVDVSLGGGTLQLDERNNHPLGVLARNGFWEDDFAVTATLTNSRIGGIAFRIQGTTSW